MNECTVVAAPGGNPAPLVALVWALLRHERLRTRTLELVLHERANHWLTEEFFAGDRPLDQLRAVAADPTLADLRLHHAVLPDGTPIEDDADLGAASAFVEALWAAVTRAQAESEAPVVLALVGGSRRTLAAHSVVAFQLLARPQDRLVDVRVSLKWAREPRSRFYFPEQLSPATLAAPSGPEGGGALARDVEVSLVPVPVPRLRRLLAPEALASFAAALAAGEEAIASGPEPTVTLAGDTAAIQVGSVLVPLSYDQLLWFSALAVARRRHHDDGWLNVTDTVLVQAVHDACRKAWGWRAGQLSDAWEFAQDFEERAKRLGPIRTRLRLRLACALRGHPHRDHVVPQKRRQRGQACERIGCSPSRLSLPPFLEELCP